MIATRGARGDTILPRTHWSLACPAASLHSAPKTKKFPYNQIFGGGVWGGADRKRKGYFFVLGSPLRPPKSSVSVSIIFESLPLRFSLSSRRARRAPVANPRGISNVRSLHSSTSAQLARSVRASCCGASVCELGGFV